VCDDCGTAEYMAPEVMMKKPYGKVNKLFLPTILINIIII